MRRELSSQEIIRAGRAHETRAVWERVRAFAWALYGPSAVNMTYSQATFSAGDHYLRTIQVLVFDGTGRLVPYDFAAPWWSGRDMPESVLVGAREHTLDDMARGLGRSFPDSLRDDLRAFAEERLGVETLHIWPPAEDESATLTWMFELSTPPPVPFAQIAGETGQVLSGEELVAAGLEREELARWAGVREYVHTLYGEQAVRAEVSMFSRYNDNTYDRDILLDVFDAADTRQFYDLHLPWWERFAFSEREIASYIAEQNPDAPGDGEYDVARSYEVDARARADIERLATVLLGADFIGTRNPLDTDTSSYDLAHQPALRFPRLWMLAGSDEVDS